MGSLHTSLELSSSVSLQRAPGWMTTLYLAGNLTSLSFLSFLSLGSFTFNLAKVFLFLLCPLGFILIACCNLVKSLSASSFFSLTASFPP